MPTDDEVDTSRTADAAALREKQARELRKEQRREFWRGLRLRLWCRLSKRQPGPAVAPGWPSRSGKTLPITTLSPEFRPSDHQLYVDLLERALRHPDVHSIALTGAYGSGKSSVLRALKRHWWRRRSIVELSLSTLDPDLSPLTNSKNPAEREVSNRIQKELVKQLLYRLPTWRTPQSRFPRATRLWLWPGVLTLAVGPAFGAVAWLVAHIVGWDAVIDARFTSIGWVPIWAWPGLSLLLGLLILGSRWALSGRYSLHAGVEAGALSVSLEPTSSSYFDQYLDEIVYFFQTSRARVVLIEDVDRFDDVVVFDTLRALNTLVNRSGQVRRRVVFVYAIRDSVLARIGAEPELSVSAEASAQTAASGVDRANRTKYFDVVIPLVPFVTADSARDLMMRVMSPHIQQEPAPSNGVAGISPALIRLAARHVADMRTILSIRNEFEIHLDRLITSAEKRVPEISKDAVFALVLLRASCPEVFEGIRLKSSPLDALASQAARLVEEKIKEQTDALTALRTQLENGAPAESRAELAGHRLDTLRAELATLVAGSVAGAVTFGGPLTDEDLADVDGWKKIADGEPLTVELRQSAARPPSATLSLSRSMLSPLIGLPIEPGEWERSDLQDLASGIHGIESELRALRHLTWRDLYIRKDLKLAPTEEERAAYSKAGLLAVDQLSSGSSAPGSSPAKSTRVDFAALVKYYSPSPLVEELIAAGYLTRHFARYAAVFYGEVVGLDAAEYIARAIEPGVPNTEFALDDIAVSQILEEQKVTDDDADFFDDVSVYNLDLVDYLVRKRPGAARRVADHLATRWGKLEQEFVERFLQRARTATHLAGLMSPTWIQGLRYTAIDLDVPPKARLDLVSAVLAAMAEPETQAPDPDVANYLSVNYKSIRALKDPSTSRRAAIAVGAAVSAGARFGDLEGLSRHALEAVAALAAYPVTASNLRALREPSGISLDVLRSKPKDLPIYEHLIGNLSAYLVAIAELDPPVPPVLGPNDLSSVLNDVAKAASEELYGQFISALPPTLQIEDLDTVNEDLWPAIVESGRTQPTYGNVRDYCATYGVDEVLAGLLSEGTEIVMPEPSPPVVERLDLAVEFLASRGAIASADRRTSLAASLAPGLIPISKIAKQDASLVGPLLAKGLLADELETFDPGLLEGWEDLEPAIAASRAFGEFVDGTVLPARYLALALRSEVIPEDTKAAFIENLSYLMDGASRREATSIAEALAGRSDVLGVGPIEELRTLGASTDSVVQLLARQGRNVSVPQLRSVLRSLPGDYARVADGGRGVVHFEDNEANRLVLDRLRWITHNGASPSYTLRHGTKLSANLRSPSS